MANSEGDGPATPEKERGKESLEEEKELNGSHDPYFTPVVSLPEVDVPTGEDDEDVLFKMRAKLYRFDAEVDPAQWKERGTGDVKLLRHKDHCHVRMLMRRDKTLKVCANHFVRPWMILNQMQGSDRCWMWRVHADFADEQMKSEVFAIRFSDSERSSKFKAAFDDAVMLITELEAKSFLRADDDEKAEEEEDEPEGEVAEEMGKLDIAKS